MFHTNIVQLCNPFHDDGFMPCTHQCFVGLKFELGVNVYVQGKYFPLTQLNYYPKVTDENILQLIELDEIMDRLQQGKYGSKPQHDLHITKEVEVYFCFLITRAINWYLH